MTKHYTYFLFVCLFAISSCMTPEKLALQGNYEQAIDLALRRLAKPKKKDKDIIALETAFKRANQRDLDRIVFLKKDGQPDNWQEINAISQNIKRRQERVKVVTPLYIDSEGGRIADFDFVEADELILESKEKAAAFHYAKAQKLIAQAEKGDRLAAREAYAELDKTKKYYKSYKDREVLMAKASNLGINHIYFKMKNSSKSVLPPGFEQELTRIAVDDLNRKWVRFYMTSQANIRFDYEVVANLTQTTVGPDAIKEREYFDRKEIKDGFEYVLDENGNVAKDSLGNDIKVDRFITIEAAVYETHQHKEAEVLGRLEFFNNKKGGELIKTVPLASKAIFDNYAATFRGDKRALSPESKRRLGNSPVPFPNDAALLLQAAEILKPNVKQGILDNKGLLER